MFKVRQVFHSSVLRNQIFKQVKCIDKFALNRNCRFTPKTLAKLSFHPIIKTSKTHYISWSMDMSHQSKTSVSDSDLPLHYSAKYKGSFAYRTVKDRLPVILVKVIDTLCRSKADIATEFGETAAEESKDVIGRLSQLQNEMVTDKDIKPLVCESPDTDIWNNYLERQQAEFGFPPSWFKSPWLYVECYLYRRIKQAFELSSTLQEFDPFREMKKVSFLNHMDTVIQICTALEATLSELNGSSDAKDLLESFEKYLQLSLWGNQCDLSMSSGKIGEGNNPLLYLNKLKKNILVDDTSRVWDVLQEAKKQDGVQIDFVLDNAGFELFCDLCFLHFLQKLGLVEKVRLYVKAIPWFVSDTLVYDIDWLLQTLCATKVKILGDFGQVCASHIISGRWSIEEEKFWTLPHDFSEMKTTDTQLYNKLGSGNLVIFKGDLNYRKLAGDRQWDETTSFSTALCGFLPTNVLSLRTIKADVIVGLEEGTTANLCKVNEDWKITGDYAVIQFAQKSIDT